MYWEAAKMAGAETLGAGAASAGLNKLFGSKGESRSKARNNWQQDMGLQHEWDVKKARLGRDIDVGAQQEMFDFRLNRAKEAGLTNVEAFGSPAAGGGGGTGAGTTTLGNSASTTGAQLRQAQMQQKIASEERQKDRMTSLAQTAMQTSSQQKVAETQVNAQTRGQDISAATAAAQQAIDQAYKQGSLAINRDTLNNNIRQTSANIKKSQQETAKLVNEVATSDKKFVEAMKQLSMGPANLLVELTMRHHKIALNDKSFMALDKDQREAILGQILALSSVAYVEGQGAAALGNDAVNGAEGFFQQIWSVIKNPLGLHKPIEQTESSPSLGFKPPKSLKRQGVAGPQPFKTY